MKRQIKIYILFDVTLQVKLLKIIFVIRTTFAEANEVYFFMVINLETSYLGW